MSLPGINFALRILKFGGDWCWVDSAKLRSQAFSGKDLQWFLFLSWWLLCCAVSTRAHLVLMWVGCMWGHEACGRWRWLEAGWATLQLAAYLE